MLKPLTVLATTLALFGLACAGESPRSAEAGPQAKASRAPSAPETPVRSAAHGPAHQPIAIARADDWQDPEPPDAQQRAVAVLHAKWNHDKTRSFLAPRSTRLSMRMSTIVDRTTGLQGFAQQVSGDAKSLDDRLAELGAKISEHEIVITLSGSVLFDFDKDDIRTDAARVLGEVARVLEQTAPRSARVEGHTDSIGSHAYNEELSLRRAQSVQSWLVAQGVTDQRLNTLGFGEEQPVAENDSAEGRQLNRRVEIVIERS